MDEEFQNKSMSFTSWAISTVTDLLEKSIDYGASFSIGQYILRKIDKILWIIEKTALWSVPYKKIETIQANGDNTPPVLIRPLPWILFFPILITLCLFRKSVNIFTVLTGMETRISPEYIVKYIQSKRKYIRRVRFSGLTTMRARNAEKQGDLSILARIRKTCMQAICMPGYRIDEPISKDVRITNGREETDSGEEDDDDETMEEFLNKITKISEMDSESDSDYLPEDDESDEDEDEESSEYESPLKVIPLKEKGDLYQRSNSITVISEENEDSEIENQKSGNGNIVNGVTEQPGSIDRIPENVEEDQELQENKVEENGHAEEDQHQENHPEDSKELNNVHDSRNEDSFKEISNEVHHGKENGGNVNEAFIQHEQACNSRPVENGEPGPSWRPGKEDSLKINSRKLNRRKSKN